MATARRHRSRISQPELPLPAPDGDSPEGPAGATPLVDWRLDERTRTVGLEGIAAARAQLVATAGSATGRSEATEREAGRAA